MSELAKLIEDERLVIERQQRRITALEAENKSLLDAVDSYSHEREMNADVACALKQRDDALKALAEERAKSERYRKEALDALSKLAIAQLRADMNAALEEEAHAYDCIGQHIESKIASIEGGIKQEGA